MTSRSNVVPANNNSLTRLKQQDNKWRDATPSLRTETTAPCSDDDEGSPEKRRVKVKLRTSAADSNHRSLNAIQLEQAIRNLQKKEPTENKNCRTSSGTRSQSQHALERFHQSCSGDSILVDNKNENHIARKSKNAPVRSGSVSRRRSTTPRDRSRERSTRTSRTVQDPPTTPRTVKSSHTTRREQCMNPLRTPRVPQETAAARSTTPKRLSSKRMDLVVKTPTTPVRFRPETPRRVSSRVQEPPQEGHCRRSVSRTRSNHLEYFTPADVAFPDPWADVRNESTSSENNRVHDLVLQSGIITASQLKQLLLAGFTFNGPEFLDAFP